ncbi:MAG TPA: GIY-YIG nuclease family protein [Alphaproteobacteria bacterium]|nr:GIY-YIG nuclease family protein [Alphaproteobacteria bacterium]
MRRGLPGVYALLFHLDRDRRLGVGHLGCSSFPRGWYAYVGSAMAGLDRRLRHHLQPHRRPHWHIDYLLPQGRLAAVIVGYTANRLECALASALAADFRAFHRFGSSDCRCPGHLFHARSRGHLSHTTLKALEDLGCATEVIWAAAAAPQAPTSKSR